MGVPLLFPGGGGCTTDCTVSGVTVSGLGNGQTGGSSGGNSGASSGGIFATGVTGLTYGQIGPTSMPSAPPRPTGYVPFDSSVPEPGLASTPFIDDLLPTKLGATLIAGAVRMIGIRSAAKAASEIASASNYRSLFVKARPDLPKDWAVHHSMPQKYEELMRSAGVNIHDVQFLRGVSPQLHSKVTMEWARFDRAVGGNPTAAQVADFAKQVDKQYGGSFVWPGF